MFTTLLKKEVRIVFVIALLTSTLLATYFTPKVSASPTPTIFISPSSGHVGDSVRVIGAIDTANGTYNIFFDEEKMANGTASPQKAVNTTFLVPHRYKGNYMVKMYDISANTNSTPTYFIVDTNYYVNAIMPLKQTQLMEGQSTMIRVNVTGGENKPYSANVTVALPPPVNTVYHNSSIQLMNTTRPGEYIAESIYPKNFGSNAHTNYTGTYTIAFNTTLAVGSFNVGLTNATQYHILNTVAIQAANYTKPSESAWINIISAGNTFFSNNISAIGGIVKANWTIPQSTALGIFNVTVASSTSSKTIKPIGDTQIFAIGFQFQIQIKNLDNEDVRGVGVTAAAYNNTNRRLAANVTSDTGFARLWLEPYAYYFRVSLKGVEGVQVGSIQALNVTGNVNQTLVVQLANIKLSVTDETGKPLRFIAIDLEYNYTKIGGGTFPETRTLETDTEGSVFFKNTFANISYLIEAKRYGSIFNRTTIGNLTASQWINITCPTYPLVVNLVDSEGHPLPNISVNITEWSSELLMGNKTWTTNDRGSVPLNLTFGRYKVKAYDYSAELDRLVVLNETVIDLLPQKGENKLFRTIYCRIVNLSPSPSILVIDYFGQPIPNAEVKVERFSEIEQKWVEITLSQRFTGSDGVALLPHIGGDYSISISVLGQLSSIKSFYIDETSVLVFKIDRYTTIGGFVLETSQLIVYIALGLLIISLGIVLTYKKILQKIMKK